MIITTDTIRILSLNLIIAVMNVFVFIYHVRALHADMKTTHTSALTAPC